VPSLGAWQVCMSDTGLRSADGSCNNATRTNQPLTTTCVALPPCPVPVVPAAPTAVPTRVVRASPAPQPPPVLSSDPIPRCRPGETEPCTCQQRRADGVAVGSADGLAVGSDGTRTCLADATSYSPCVCVVDLPALEHVETHTPLFYPPSPTAEPSRVRRRRCRACRCTCVHRQRTRARP
jgi:hypothetical protein